MPAGWSFAIIDVMVFGFAICIGFCSVMAGVSASSPQRRTGSATWACSCARCCS